MGDWVDCKQKASCLTNELQTHKCQLLCNCQLSRHPGMTSTTVHLLACHQHQQLHRVTNALDKAGADSHALCKTITMHRAYTTQEPYSLSIHSGLAGWGEGGRRGGSVENEGTGATRRFCRREGGRGEGGDGGLGGAMVGRMEGGGRGGDKVGGKAALHQHTRAEPPQYDAQRSCCSPGKPCAGPTASTTSAHTPSACCMSSSEG